MPVFNKVMTPHKKVFTHQDFLDGLCDKDGLPLNKSKETQFKKITDKEDDNKKK